MEGNSRLLFLRGPREQSLTSAPDPGDERRPFLHPYYASTVCCARDAAHALERAGVNSGQEVRSRCGVEIGAHDSAHRP
jgi:hypothetical protein